MALLAALVVGATVVTFTARGGAVDPAAAHLTAGLGLPSATTPADCLAGFDAALSPTCTRCDGVVDDATVVCPGHRR